MIRLLKMIFCKHQFRNGKKIYRDGMLLPGHYYKKLYGVEMVCVKCGRKKFIKSKY